MEPDFNTTVVKSKSELKKDADAMYKSSFGDLPDGTIYRDPAGWRTRGESVELQKSRWEQMKDEPVDALGGRSIIEKWNELQKKGFSLKETTETIRKSLDTGDWTLPLDIVPDVFVVNPERTPLADMMTRVTTQDDEVVATPLEDHPNIDWGLEAGAATDGDGNRVYSYEQPTYGDLTYPVEGYGAATRLSDKLILSASNLRNAESTQEQAFVRAMRQEEERQVIYGTGNSADGFDGLTDIGNQISDLGDPSSLTPADVEERTRELIDEAEYEGAPREDLAVVCDFDWHKKLREAITDRVRYSDPGQEIGAGFTALDFDGVPVMKSHAITRLSDVASTNTEDVAFAVNMNATYLSMLQETSVRPLARLGPQERMAVDAYGTLTAEAPDHINYYSVTAP